MSKCQRTSQRLAEVQLACNDSASITAASSKVAGGRNNSKIMKKWWRDHRKAIKDDKEALAATSDVSAENEANKGRIEELEAENSSKNKAIKELELENNRLKAEIESTKLVGIKAAGLTIKKETDRKSILKMIGDVIVAVMSIIISRTQAVTRVRTLYEVIFTNQLYGPVATEAVVREMSKSYARKHIFVPWKVLQSIDMAINGGINFTGIESLRKVENLDSYERGFLPSRSSVQRCAAELHELGQEKVPFYKVESELGEMYQFHYEKMLRYVLKTFQLDEIAQRDRVELCITLDGAELTKDLCHLTFGIKVTDARVIDPRDGSPLSYQEDGVFGNLFRVQSRNYCFIMKTLLGKDSKAAYREFSDVFLFFEKVFKEGLPENRHGPKIVPLLIWSPQDLSSLWKSLNTGSGARKTGDKHFCYLCSCTGGQIGSFLVEGNR
jgi:flagellar biosynthesis regulator FlbT